MNPEQNYDEVSESKEQELEQLEETIKRGQTSFDEVGSALRIIQDKQLYRTTHKSFNDYCKERWEMTPRHAYYLIKAAKVMENLKENVNSCSQILPANEAQIRPLTALSAEQQCQVWQQAIDETAPDGKKPTAELVKKITEKFRAANPSKSAKPPTRAKKVRQIYAALSALKEYTAADLKEFIYSPEGQKQELAKLAHEIAKQISLGLEADLTRN